MFGNINVNKSSIQLMVFNPVSRSIRDADNIGRTIRAENAGVELFRMSSCFNKRFFSTNRGILVSEKFRKAHDYAPLVLEHAAK
jgi:hypothetical protein